METTWARSGPLPVLCLDDDQHFGRALTVSIRDRDVDWVQRDAAARERIAARRYAAWLLDVRVPDGSGLEVLAWARARGDETPTLVMTGDPTHDLVNEAQHIGAELVLKPFSSANVAAFLARCDARRVPSIDAWAADFVLRHRLPKRQRDVVGALLRGVPRVGLADTLGISENTVKSTIRLLLKRTDHESVDELVREMLQARAPMQTRPSPRRGD